MSRNKYKNLLKDTGIFAIGNFGSNILSFLFVSVYTAYLTTAEYGVSNVITTSISLIVPILTMAIYEAILRFACDESVSKSQIFSISIVMLFGATIINIFLSAIAMFFFPSILLYIKYYMILFFLIAVELSLSNFIKGLNKTVIFAVKGIVYTMSFIICNILFLVVFKLGIKGYFSSMIIAYTISILVMCIGGKIYNYRFDWHINRKLLRKMLLYSLPIVPASISWWINSSADIYMITWLAGVDYAGVYSVAHKIPSIVTSVATIFTAAWQLSAMKNYDTNHFGDFFSNIFNMVNYILIFGSTVCILLCQIFSKGLFQKEFFVAWKYVPMLMVAGVFSTIAGMLASAYTSARKTNILFISTVIAALSNIVLNYFFIKHIGVFGAAISTMISFALMNIIRIRTMKKIVQINVDWVRLIISYGILALSSYLLFYYENQFYLIAIIMALFIFSMNFKPFKKIVKVIINDYKRQ